jgi:putative addiction module killer protein
LLKVIKIYSNNGKEPVKDWLSKLKDKTIRVRIRRRIDRLELGNYGDHRYLSGGLFELKLDIGPGYRIYCGEEDRTIIVLLCGGDKSSQHKDIIKAKEYWKTYLMRKKEWINLETTMNC